MLHSGGFIVDDPAESTVSPADLTRCQEAGRLVLLAASPCAIPPDNQSLSLNPTFDIEALFQLTNTELDDVTVLESRQTRSRRELEAMLLETANDNQAGILQLMAMVAGHRFAVIRHVFGSCSPVGRDLWDDLMSTTNQPLSSQRFGEHMKSAFDQVKSSLYDEEVERVHQAARLVNEQRMQLETNAGQSSSPVSSLASSPGNLSAAGNQATTPAPTLPFSVPTFIGNAGSTIPVRQTVASNPDLTGLLVRLGLAGAEWVGAGVYFPDDEPDDMQTRPVSSAGSQTAAEDEGGHGLRQEPGTDGLRRYPSGETLVVAGNSEESASGSAPSSAHPRSPPS
jgi:hypothetical protein